MACEIITEPQLAGLRGDPKLRAGSTGLLRAAVRHASARIAIPPTCVGYIDQRKLRRRVGPTQVEQIALRPAVEKTEALAPGEIWESWL
jgi:hypothetical protein